VAALLDDSGMVVGKDRVQRIWRREGLKLRDRQESCAPGRLTLLAHEPFAEDDGELGSCFEPFARRVFPVALMVENKILQFHRRVIIWEVASDSDRSSQL
jgi:hypothetical protein